jgi:hypothetical protein
MPMSCGLLPEPKKLPVVRGSSRKSADRKMSVFH